ncbi:MAG TPA: ABC transporter permease, partial [Vicinamibacterales bacterium]
MPEWPDSLNEEVRQHLDDRYEELRTAGMDHARAVRLSLQEIETARPRDLVETGRLSTAPVPGASVGSIVGNFASDLRYATRMILRYPRFAAIVALTLGLGIGVNSALFSVVNGVLLRPLPYPHPEQLVGLGESKANFPNGSISFPNFRDWRDNNRTFAAMAVSRGSGFTMTGRGPAEPVVAQFVSSDFFSILGIEPVIGRFFHHGEDEIGAAPIVLVSDAFWKERLGASPAILGQTLTLDGRAFTIVGVVPAAFDFAMWGFSPTEIYAPIGQWTNNLLNNRAAGLGIHGIGRLRPGVTIEQARDDMAAVTRGLTAAFPEIDKGIGATITPMTQAVVGRVRPYLLALAAAVGFVLLIACANV